MHNNTRSRSCFYNRNNNISVRVHILMFLNSYTIWFGITASIWVFCSNSQDMGRIISIVLGVMSAGCNIYDACKTIVLIG